MNFLSSFFFIDIKLRLKADRKKHAVSKQMILKNLSSFNQKLKSDKDLRYYAFKLHLKAKANDIVSTQ